MGALRYVVFFVASMAPGALFGAILVGSFMTSRRGEPALRPGAVIGAVAGLALGWLVLLSNSGAL